MPQLSEVTFEYLAEQQKWEINSGNNAYSAPIKQIACSNITELEKITFKGQYALTVHAPHDKEFPEIALKALHTLMGNIDYIHALKISGLHAYVFVEETSDGFVPIEPLQKMRFAFAADGENLPRPDNFDEDKFNTLTTYGLLNTFKDNQLEIRQELIGNLTTYVSQNNFAEVSTFRSVGSGQVLSKEFDKNAQWQNYGLKWLNLLSDDNNLTPDVIQTIVDDLTAFPMFYSQDSSLNISGTKAKMLNWLRDITSRINNTLIELKQPIANLAAEELGESTLYTKDSCTEVVNQFISIVANGYMGQQTTLNGHSVEAVYGAGLTFLEGMPNWAIYGGGATAVALLTPTFSIVAGVVGAGVSAVTLVGGTLVSLIPVVGGAYVGKKVHDHMEQQKNNDGEASSQSSWWDTAGSFATALKATAGDIVESTTGLFSNTK